MQYRLVITQAQYSRKEDRCIEDKLPAGCSRQDAEAVLCAVCEDMQHAYSAIVQLQQRRNSRATWYTADRRYMTGYKQLVYSKSELLCVVDVELARIARERGFRPCRKDW